MYTLTNRDFEDIRNEALHPDPDGSCYDVTFAVMEQLFPPFLYARRSSFCDREELEDCLSAAELRVAERIRRYYFEREDIPQNADTLQRWMLTVLKNEFYTVQRKVVSGRDAVERLTQNTVSEWGITRNGDGGMNLDSLPEDGLLFDGGFDEIYRREDEKERREVLKECFSAVLSGKSEPQIVLAWLTVSALVLCRDMKKKDAIALLAQNDPTMGELFDLLFRLLNALPWLGLTEKDLRELKEKLNRDGGNGKPFAECRFGDFTDQTVREYISKSVNKRNTALTKSHRADWDF